MEVEIVSKETIKPTSPTSPHLKTFKISLIDRIFPKAYTPFLMYYAIQDPIEVPVDRFKCSLAETLTRFYPLAGRANYTDHTIDCNDKGVLFTTARVKCNLADVLKDPKIEEFHKFFIPLPPICPEDLPEDGPSQIGVQFNVFECGGVAISFCVYHMICDAITVIAFLKCWSEISRGSQDQVHVYPSFPAAELFPHGDEAIAADSSNYMMERSLLTEGRGVIRRFVFGKQEIAALRDKARSDCLPNATRVEAVAMFIWKHCMLASAEVWGARDSLLNFAVDLRRRMVPPLSEYSIGNILWKVMMRKGSKDEMDIDELLNIFRAAMQKDREMIISKLKNNDGKALIIKYMQELKETCSDKNLNPYNMTSWCRLGFIDIDFGWGKPVWVSQPGSNNVRSEYKNHINLLDGPTGESIEAWLILDHRDMVVLENDSRFLTFASINPSVLM